MLHAPASPVRPHVEWHALQPALACGTASFFGGCWDLQQRAQPPNRCICQPLQAQYADGKLTLVGKANSSAHITAADIMVGPASYIGAHAHAAAPAACPQPSCTSACVPRTWRPCIWQTCPPPSVFSLLLFAVVHVVDSILLPYPLGPTKATPLVPATPDEPATPAEPTGTVGAKDMTPPKDVSPSPDAESPSPSPEASPEEASPSPSPEEASPSPEEYSPVPEEASPKLAEPPAGGPLEVESIAEAAAAANLTTLLAALEVGAGCRHPMGSTAYG